MGVSTSQGLARMAVRSSAFAEFNSVRTRGSPREFQCSSDAEDCAVRSGIRNFGHRTTDIGPNQAAPHTIFLRSNLLQFRVCRCEAFWIV
jgi:hypothetical protein